MEILRQKEIRYDELEKEQLKRNIDELYFFINNRNVLLTKGQVQADIIDWIKNNTNIDNVNNKKVVSWFRKYNKGLKVRIKNYCDKYYLDMTTVMDKVFNDTIFALQFAKNPIRQTIHQTYLVNWMKENIPMISNVKELPATGSDALFIEGSGIVQGKKNRRHSTKSIDIYWEYKLLNKTLKFYASHKYTKDFGGSQDNQMADLFHFMDKSRNIIDEDKFIFAIADGKYYQSKFKKVKNSAENKIGYMNVRYGGYRNKAVSSNELTLEILNVIEKWINNTFESDEFVSDMVKNELELIQDYQKQIIENSK